MSEREPRNERDGTLWGVDLEGLKWAVGDEEHDGVVIVPGAAFCWQNETTIRVYPMDDDLAKVRDMDIDFRRCIVVILEDLGVQRQREAREAGADPVQEP